MVNEDFMRDFFGLPPKKSRAKGLDALIGKRCQIIFNLAPHDWPIGGYPAWAYVIEVDQSMMRLGATLQDDGQWVSINCIRTIRR